MKKLGLVFALMLSGLVPQFAQAETPAMRQSTPASITYGTSALQALRQSHRSLFQNGKGVLVVGVMIGSQADAAGILISDLDKGVMGDVVVNYASQPIDTAESFTAAVTSFGATPGSVEMTVIRDKAKLIVKLASGRVGIQMLTVASPPAPPAPPALPAGWTLEGGTPTTIVETKPQIFAQLGQASAAVVVSADGRFALSYAANTVKLWDITSGREMRTLTEHADRITSVAFSPDGKYALSGGADSVWKLLEIATGNTIYSIKGHSSGGVRVDFSPDGRQALTGGDDQQIKLWDLATGTNIRTMSDLPGQAGPVAALAFSPDGRQALTTTSYASKGWSGGYSMHYVLKLWEVASGRLLKTLDSHSLSVVSIAFSPDGRQALSGSHDKTVKLWDLDTGKTIRTMDGDAFVYTVDFSPDGKQGLSAGQAGVKLWDLQSGRELRTFKGLLYLAAAFSPDGRQALTANYIEGLRLWDLASGTLIPRFFGNAFIGMAPAAFSPDGKRVVSGGPMSTEIWDVTSGKRTVRSMEGNGLLAIAFSPDGRQLLSGHSDKIVRLRDAGTGELLRSFSGHSNMVMSVALSRDGSKALSSGLLEAVRLWDVASGKTIRTLPGKHGNIPISSVALSPDGKQALSSALAPEGLKLWDLASGKAIRTVSGTSFAAAISPDGRYALSAISDAGAFPIRLLDLETGLEIRRFIGHTGMVRTLAFSPDGTLALSGSWDSTMKLWDVATGKELRTFAGHTGEVNTVAFSPDGRLALSASVDTAIRLWDIATGKNVIQMVAFDDGEWIAITPDGYYNASPNGDRYLNVRIGNQVYGIENYREAFFRPDLVASAVAGGSLKGYRTIAEVKPPPQVEIMNIRPTVVGDEFNVELKLADTGGGIGDVRLYLNGTAIMMDNTRGITLVAKERKAGASRSYKIRLAQGDNIIRAVAFNADNTMQSNPAELRVTATFTPAAAKPTLHALVIGINEYKNPKLRLQYAVPDAELFSDTLQHGATNLFGQINVVRLTTPAQTTSANIANELKKMQSINPDDLFILFVASHGTVDDGEYFLITSNVGSTSTAKLKTDALSQDRIKELIANIPATKKVIMLDTCNAGQLGDAIQVALLTRGMSEDTAFKILSRAVGSTVLSSATSTQEALEGYRGHGLFTWVLAEGMKGKADKGKSGYIKTTDLVDYVESEVPEIAENHFKRKQYPTTAVSGQGFPIGKIGL